MTLKALITVLIIYLFIPLFGLFSYLRLIRRAEKEKINNLPKLELFILFSTYGGLLLVVLTQIFWEWSGMASLGMIYLVIFAPITMAVTAALNFKKRFLSKYHLCVYRASLLYFVIGPIVLGGLIFML
jgi:hypothetical protein